MRPRARVFELLELIDVINTSSQTTCLCFIDHVYCINYVNTNYIYDVLLFLNSDSLHHETITFYIGNPILLCTYEYFRLFLLHLLHQILDIRTSTCVVEVKMVVLSPRSVSWMPTRTINSRIFK